MKRTSISSRIIVVVLLITGLTASARALELSGRCYSGQWPDESNELQGVPLTLYGAAEAGGARTQLDTATSGSNGWYGLTIQEGYEHYFIVAGNITGYTFDDSSSVDGTASGNEIHYSTISAPLSEQTLTGNKFWYISDTPENNPPVATDDSATTSENTAVDIYVLANDTDLDGDPLHINSATDPAHGTTINHGTHITYTPDSGFTGADTFDYIVGDGKGGTDTATVTVTVEEGEEPPENNPPVADADGPYTGQVGQSITLDGSGSYDPDPGDSIVSYEWDLDNDGQYDDASGVSTSWTWAAVGMYPVGLRVTDSYGESDTDTSTVDVQEEEPPEVTGILEGYKRDAETQEGLEGWRIYIDLNGNGERDEGEPFDITDSTGYYQIPEIEPGTYRVCEQMQEGWEPDGGSSPCMEGINIIAGTTTTLDFYNRRTEGPEPGTGVIRGMKFNDLNGNGQRDPDEPGLSDWEIRLMDSEGIISATTMTNQNGEYQFDNLEPGTYGVSEEDKQDWVQTFPPEQHYSGVMLSEDEVLTDLDFGNCRTGTPPEGGNSIRGMKYNDLNSNSQRDPSEPGLANWTIYLDLNDNGSYDEGEPQTTTDTNGNYSFIELEAGVYRIHEVNQTGWHQTDPAVDGVSGYWMIDLEEGQEVTEIDFGNIRSEIPDLCEYDVSGVKYNDLNGNGQWDLGNEPGLAGWRIYQDLNDNGMWDEGEPNGVTDADGRYGFRIEQACSLEEIPPIREVLLSGWVQTEPGAPLYAYHDLSWCQQIWPEPACYAVNFGNTEEGTSLEGDWDFGDAPQDGITYFYPITLANNGARHRIDPDVYLGSGVEGDPDGQPDLGAQGDDNDGNDDEDGVIFKTPIVPGTIATVTVTASVDGLLSGWIDFDHDGRWDVPRDYIFSSFVATAGTRDYYFDVPADALPGATYARFRFVVDEVIEQDGLAQQGEVEDYAVEINEPSGDSGNITIIKAAIPEDSSQLFNFTGDLGDFTLSPGSNKKSFSNLSPGNYQVIETLPSGWFLGNYQIAGDLDGGTTHDSLAATWAIDLDAGENIWIVIYNYKGGKIIVEKRTIPAGAPDSFTFTGDCGGSINDGGQLWVDNLQPGQYKTTEVATTGWQLSNIIIDDKNSTFDLDTRTATFNVEAGETVKAVFSNRKATSTPAPVTFPQGDWPTYAQDEISVHPEPPTAGSLTRLCAEVVNNDSVNAHVVTLEFRVANFGIGLPWNAVGSTSVLVPPGSVASGCVVWTPPGPGHWCIEVVLHQEGAEPQRSQRNIDADEPLQPGESHSLTFPLGNPLDHTVDITLGLVPHLPNWGLELYPDFLLDMAPGEIREVTLTVTPPQGEPLPPDGTVIVDVEAYAEGELIGGFRKTFRPPIPLHRFPDPPYAEGEITVHPYPVQAGEPTEICVELRNPKADPQDVMVQFSWANFGIGIPFTPINGLRSVHLPPHSIVKECIHWIPPVSGSVCIQVELHMEGYDPQCSQRNIDIDEPLQPGESHSLTFPVGNSFDHRVDITLGLVPHLPNWGLELYPDILLDMAPGEIREVTLTVTPPLDEPLPPAEEVIVDVEAYAEGELIGGFRKVFSPPVTVHRPKDPVYAETEIGVDPYPIVPGQQVELSVELRNPTDTDQVVQTRFSVAPFGIGLPFSDEHIMPNPIQIFVPAHGAARGHVTWNPPPGVTGKFCVQVTLELEGHEPLWSRRCIDVGEPLQPGEPHSLTFPVGNPLDHTVDITLGLVPHLPNWGLELYPDILLDMAPGEIREVTLTVTPPQGEPLPPNGTVIVDVEAYAEGELIGGFRKLNVPPVSVHKLHEKTYAETEISVDPDPPQEGQETTVSAMLHNTGDVPVVVNVEFGWADFGMGIPFSNVGIVPPVQMVTLAPSALTSVDAAWTPIQSGHQCILIRLTDPDGQLDPQESQRNVDVTEPPPCGETKVFTFTIYNDSPSTVTVDLGLITFNVPSDWEVTTNPTGSVLIGPHDEVEIKVIVKIPCPPSLQVADILQRVGGGVPTIDVEGYTNGVLKGGIQIQFGEIITEPGSALPTGQIHHSKSINNGTVFEPGSVVEKAAAGSAQINPDIAVDDQGMVHIVWEDYRTDPYLGNIMYAKSTDGGISFDESVMVDDEFTVSTHQAKPKIAVDNDGIIHVVWEDYRHDLGLGDIYYAKSTNGGITFSDDVCVDDPITVTSRQIHPVIAVDSQGIIHVAWEDYRDNAELGNIYYAISTDGGQTFGPDVRVDDIFTDTTHQCNPAIATGPLGTVFIVWEDYRNAPHLGDIYCARSTNNGVTFEDDLMVEDSFTISHRQIHPDITVDDQGIVYVVWEDYRDNTELGNIYCARSIDSGNTFESDVMVDATYTHTTHQANPAIASNGLGLVHIVWEDYRDHFDRANIYYSKSVDEGKVFGEDLKVNEPEATSSQLNPAIAVDNLGVVHLVWQE